MDCEITRLNVAKRAIFHRVTGLYYAGEGRWTEVFDEAKNFPNFHEMVDEVKRHKLGESCGVVVQSEGGLIQLEIRLA